MIIALDSSVLIEYFRTNKGLLPKLIQSTQSHHDSIIIPTIVVYELWKGRSMSNKAIAKNIEDMLQQFSIASDTMTIAKRAGEMERERVVSGYDAIIAATCLEHHAQLATLNAKDFSRVPHLKIWGK